MEGRRKFKRVSVEVVFMYELQNCDAVDDVTLHSMGTAVIRNISLGGSSIRTLGQQLPEGCKLRVSIMSTTGGESIEIIGRIVWSKEVEPETFDCGIRFLEYEGESMESLRKYIESLAEGTG